MGKTQAPVRASGKTPADEAAADEAQALMQPVQEAKQTGERGMPLNLNGGPPSRPEEKHTSLTPAFSRMRTDWNGPDREVVQEMHKGVDLMIENAFSDVFAVFYEIYRIVRVPVMDPATGEIKTDYHGLTVWQVDPDTGRYVEDWSKMNVSEREMFIYKLTTGLFRWEQRAASLWAEAMFARAAFEEAFSHGYEELSGTGPTIDDRTARARIRAADHRYFAVYTSYLSKRADAVVRSAERLNQRLKDLSL